MVLNFLWGFEMMLPFMVMISCNQIEKKPTGFIINVENVKQCFKLYLTSVVLKVRNIRYLRFKSVK